MWSFRTNRRTALLAVAAMGLVAACGFKPAFGPNGAAGELFQAVALPAPVTRDDFALNQRLQTRLGAPTNTAWQLSYEIATVQQGFSAAEVARIQLVGDMTYRLIGQGPQTGTNFAGRVSAFSAYNEGQTSATNTNTPVSTVAAAADARKRLLIQLADRMIEDLIAKMAKADP